MDSAMLTLLLATVLILAPPTVLRAQVPPEKLPPPKALRPHTPPEGLPQYQLDIHMDVAGHEVRVRERVTWRNRHATPTDRVVFNNHSHFAIADKDIGTFAKMLEILRMAPRDTFDFNGPPCTIEKVVLLDEQQRPVQQLAFHYQPQNDTALEVPLPRTVLKSEAVTLELTFRLRLPQRQGRWGQWRGVTFLAQWLPVVAYYDEAGWQPTPFIAWHQPFHNEAGVYRAKVVAPKDQVLGSTGSIVGTADLADGWRMHEIGEVVARDFSLFCSALYEEHLGDAGPVRVRVLALPEHAHYAREMVKIAQEALPVYASWFGPYAYPQLTVVESYFGWNGNECGGCVMIDERVFGMPHLARPFVDHLLTHEIGHQWFYNAVGTNGYAETWMDEGIISFYSHKLVDAKISKNNKLLEWPKGLRWLPNIQREDYRNYGMLGTVARGDAMPTVQPLPNYGHLVNLMSMTYDRGGKIVGMIEERLGSAAMFDFLRRVYGKYYFRILHVRDFQKELEEYTGHSWEDFFNQWLFGAGMSDWQLRHVEIADAAGGGTPLGNRLRARLPCQSRKQTSCKVTVYVRQKGELTAPTTVGFALDNPEHFQVRVPIFPDTPALQMDELGARVERLDANEFRIEVTLPSVPTQIAVDPDQVLVDRNPANNYWKARPHLRLTPLYCALDETDLTNNYDRWNFIFGPWIFGRAYNDPWYSRSPLMGVRAGVYGTQEFSGGAFAAYRTNDRRFVAGIDGLWDHTPWPRTQIGFHLERNLANIESGDGSFSRGVLYARYIFMYGSSMYLPPFEYVEAFGSVSNRILPMPRNPSPNGLLFDQQTSLGVHYHKYYLTPYWDPEGGVAVDATYQLGVPFFGQDETSHQVFGQVSTVQSFPDPLGLLKMHPCLAWLADTRLAYRLYGAAALPDRAQFFSLGGGELFRGFDLRERQGNMAWVASVEWRVPILRDVRCDVADHVVGLRNVYAAAFYDVGNAYLDGHQLGTLAHAVGGGLRLDVTWFGMIERTMLRFDVAQPLDSRSPVQFWVGIQHPF